MGWWNADTEGNSFAPIPTGLWWGDSVADIMDGALSAIDAEFVREFGREATGEELLSGLRFSAAVRTEGLVVDDVDRGDQSTEEKEFEDNIARARSGFDQVGKYSDEVVRWLAKRHDKMKDEGLPRDTREMLLSRLTDTVMPVSSPLDEMMRMMIERAEQQMRDDQEE